MAKVSWFIGPVLFLSGVAVLLTGFIGGESKKSQMYDDAVEMEQSFEHLSSDSFRIHKLTEKGTRIATIRVPDADIHEPVYSGPADDSTLRKGITLMHPDIESAGSNLSIAGHRMDGFGTQFSTLHRVHEGSRVYIRYDGGELVYRIIASKVVAPSEVDVLDDTGYDRLTLITCEDYDSLSQTHRKRRIYIGIKE